MAKQKADSMVLMEEVVKTAKAIGAGKTIEVLIQLRKVETSSVIKTKKDIILNEVFLEFNTSLKRLISLKHDGRYPRMFCYILLKRHLAFEAHEIARIFGRSGQTVYCEMASFGKLNPNSKYQEDAKLLARFEKLEREILNKIS